MAFIKWKLILLALLILVSGCQSITFIKKKYEMTPDSSWPDQHRAVALKSYLYAQMSNNTYGQAGDEYDSDGLDFVLPSNYTTQHVGNNRRGLAYSVYKRTNDKRLSEVVLVFRGTEGLTDKDDGIANLLAKQNPIAIDIYKELRANLNKDGHNSMPIILAGHSLGGALAIHVAINVDDNLSYYVFNTSPRFKMLGKYQKKGPERHSIVETGEFLRIARAAALEADQTYTPYDCDSGFKPFESHSIEKLATCLTIIAALNDKEANVKMVRKQ
jgi:hypothetical protein